MNCIICFQIYCLFIDYLGKIHREWGYENWQKKVSRNIIIIRFQFLYFQSHENKWQILKSYKWHWFQIYCVFIDYLGIIHREYRMWKLTEKKSFQEYHHHPWSMTTLIIKTSGCRHWQPVSSSQMIFLASFNSVACLMNVAFDVGRMYFKKWLLGSN